MNGARSLALVLASAAEGRGYPIADRLEHLRSRGWDAHLIVDHDEVGAAGLTDALEPPAAVQSVSESRAGRARGFGRALIQHAGGTGRYLRARPAPDGARPRRAVDLALTALRPGLVHFHSAGVARDCLRVTAAIRSAVLVSLTGQDLNMVRLDDPEYYSRVWDAAHLLHVPDEGMWRRALRRGCPPDGRRAFIPPAASTSYFDPSDVGPSRDAGERLRVLSVGPLVWAQGLEHALHAARILLDRGVDFEYRIVGDGEHLPAVTFARYQLGLEERVELRAPGGPDALRAELRRADVFLNAAVAEGFTEAVAEAHAMGLPVVASERGVLDASMSDDAALVAPRRDPHALAENLARVAGDPDLRRRLGERGRARVTQDFDLPQQLARFEELYRDLLAAGPPR